MRQASDVVRNRLVLTEEARRGLYRWRQPGSGAIQSFDIARQDPRGLGLDPQVQSLIQATPLPNNFDTGDGLNNGGFRFNNPNPTSNDQGLAKVDHALSSNHRLFARYSQFRTLSVDTLNNADATFPGQPPGRQLATSRGAVFGSDWVLTPRTINELRAGYQDYDVTFARTRPNGPLVVPTGTVMFNPNATGITGGRHVPMFDITDNLTLLRGKHTWKVGGSFVRTRYHQFDENASYPNLFTSRLFGNIPPAAIGPSGNALITPLDRQRFEDFYNTLLGRVSEISVRYFSDLENFLPVGAPNQRNYLFQDLAFFAQNDWKVRRNLTLNVGLRYELFRVPRERDGLQAGITPWEKTIGYQPLTNFDYKRNSGYWASDPNNFAPRIGLAWDPFGDGRTAVRASYGIHYDRQISVFTDDLNFFTPGFVANTQSLPNQSSRTDVRLRDNPALPEAPARPLTMLPATRSQEGVVASPDSATPYFQTWNVTLQREIARNTVVEAGYVGTRGLKVNLALQMNQLRIQEGFLSEFQQLRAFQSSGTPVPATNLLVRAFGSPQAAISSLGASNIQLGAAGAAADQFDRNFYMRYPALGLPDTYLRYYPQYSSFWVLGPYGRTYYDSFQLSVRRDNGWARFAANYTFSKNLDLTSDDTGGVSAVADLYDHRYNRGNSNLHLPHAFNLTGTAELPFGRNRRYLNGAPRWLDAIIGGWNLGAIALAQTGFAFGVGSPANTAAGTVTRADYNGGRIGQLERTGDGVRYFQPRQISLFSIPGAGERGTSSRNMFRGPAWWTMENSLVKRFQIVEGQTLMVRLEAANTLNSPMFGTPNTNISLPQNFGRVTGTVVGARRAQIALRYEF